MNTRELEVFAVETRVLLYFFISSAVSFLPGLRS